MKFNDFGMIEAQAEACAPMIANGSKNLGFETRFLPFGIIAQTLYRKTIGAPRAQEEIKKLLNLFEVAPVNRHILESALVADFNDFEDSVIHEAASHVGAEAIVTRNQKDFKKSRIPVYSSEEMAKILASQSFN